MNKFNRAHPHIPIEYIFLFSIEYILLFSIEYIFLFPIGCILLFSIECILLFSIECILLFPIEHILLFPIEHILLFPIDGWLVGVQCASSFCMQLYPSCPQKAHLYAPTNHECSFDLCCSCTSLKIFIGSRRGARGLRANALEDRIHGRPIGQEKPP